MSLGWITAFALAAASPSGGEHAVRVEIEGTLPFSQETLIEAVRIRVPVSTAAVDRITVRGEAGRITVAYGPRTRVLDIGRRTEAGAARRVALVVEDLLRNPVTVDLIPAPDPAPPPLSSPESPPVRAEAPPAKPLPPPSEPELWRFGLLLGPGVGALEGQPRLLAELDGSIALVGPLRLALSAGGVFTLPVERAGVQVRYTALAAKAGLGFRPIEGAWTLRVAGVFEPYFVSGGEGDHGVVPGLEASFRYGFALGALDLVGGVAATGYLQRYEFVVMGSPALTTDQLLVTILLGVVYGSDG